MLRRLSRAIIAAALMQINGGSRTDGAEEVGLSDDYA
jgi:hypothetical protein